MSSSKFSTYLFLGLPLILLPVGFHSNILLGILFSSICITCPNQAILLLFMNLTMSALPMSSFNSWFILILQDPSLSCTGPKIFLNILRSNILRCARLWLLMSKLHIRMSLQAVLTFALLKWLLSCLNSFETVNVIQLIFQEQLASFCSIHTSSVVALPLG